MISVIIVPTHVPINVVKLLFTSRYFEVEYNVETMSLNSILHCMIGLI